MLYNISMDERAEKLLRAIIDFYIKNAHPVGSQFLSEHEDLAVSSATIRNEMLALEKLGFIFQPHTSAGRIPTLAGYQYYLDNLLNIEALSEQEVKELKTAYKEDARALAKVLAEKTNLAVILAFDANDLYFTGLFNLFSQPEFADYKMMLSMSQVIDSLEKAMASIFYQIDKPKILLGEDNPFAQMCSVAVTPLNGEPKRLLAILGPARMDYNRILSLLASIVKIS